MALLAIEGCILLREMLFQMRNVIEGNPTRVVVGKTAKLGVIRTEAGEFLLVTSLTACVGDRLKIFVTTVMFNVTLRAFRGCVILCKGQMITAGCVVK